MMSLLLKYKQQNVQSEHTARGNHEIKEIERERERERGRERKKEGATDIADWRRQSKEKDIPRDL